MTENEAQWEEKFVVSVIVGVWIVFVVFAAFMFYKFGKLPWELGS